MARPNVSRTKILDAAAELAAQRGITATTVDEIAAAAGVSKGTVYYNFDSKESLYSGLIGDALERVGQRMRAGLEPAAEGDAVAGVVRAFLTGFAERPATGRVVVGEMFRLDRAWSESLTRHRAVFYSILRQALERDGRASEVAHAAAVFGAMLAVGFERLVFSPAVPLEDAVAAVAGA